MHSVKWSCAIVSALFALLLNTMAGAPALAAAAVTTVATFTLPQGPFEPSTLVEGPDGNFYGTTVEGGNPLTAGATAGTIFKMTPQGVVTILHAFVESEGTSPTGLVLASDGNFYGSTQFGGANGTGTVFKVTAAGVFTVIYSFPLPNGQSLVGGWPTQLAVGSSGALYGLAVYGGVSDCGSLFTMTLAGVPSVLYSFPLIGGSTLGGADPMTLGSDGYLYGVSNEGIFRVSPAGEFFSLYTFTVADGGAPGLTALLGSDGSVYGTTVSGGSHKTGSIYALSSAGFNVLYSFPTGNFADIAPSSLMDGGDGYFYGTTNVGGQSACQCGQIFKVSPSGTFVSAYYFDGVTLGGPTNRLIRGSDGYLYGTTQSAVYRFDTTAPPPPAITLTFSNPVIALGKSATLTWSAANATSCAASNGWTGALAPSGSVSVTPTALGESAYTLTCTGAGGSAVVTAALQVQSPASASLSISPSTVNIGQSAVLTWTGNLSCVATGAWSGTEPGAGTLTVTPSAGGTYVYTLTCTGGAADTATASATLTVNPLPTVTLSVAPATVAPGQSATVTWSTLNASSCTAANAWSGSVATAGSQAVTLQAVGNYTYTLTCSGVGGTTSTSTTLTVAVPVVLPTVTVSVIPTTVTAGQSATLTWSSTNATSCIAGNAWSGSVGTSGTQSLTPSIAGTYTYRLTCTGPGGSATNSTALAVAAPPAPPTTTLSVNPATITVGQSATLTWSSTNASACSASNGWSGALSPSGTQVVTPAAAGTVTYTLSCTGAGGTTMESATLTVAMPPPAPTVSLSSNTGTITVGQSVTLTWSSTNATECVASGAWTGPVVTSGNLPTTPLATGSSIYTLTCTGAGGSASASTTIAVTSAAAPPSGKSGGGALNWPALLGLAGILVLRRRPSCRNPPLVD